MEQLKYTWIGASMDTATSCCMMKIVHGNESLNLIKMNSNKIWYYFSLAGNVAINNNDIRTFRLGAVGIRSDGAIVMASNAPTEGPDRIVHAEYRLCQKLDANAIVFVARIRRDGSYGTACPCFACRKILKSRRVKRVYYTINDSEYGVYYPVNLGKKNEILNRKV